MYSIKALSNSYLFNAFSSTSSSLSEFKKDANVCSVFFKTPSSINLFSLKKSFKLNLILLKLGFKPSNKSFNYILYFGYQYCNRKINNNTKIKNIYSEIAIFFNVTTDSVAKAINRDFINVNLETDYQNIDLSKKENRIYNFVILNKTVKVFLFSLINYYLSIENEEFL